MGDSRACGGRPHLTQLRSLGYADFHPSRFPVRDELPMKTAGCCCSNLKSDGAIARPLARLEFADQWRVDNLVSTADHRCIHVLDTIEPMLTGTGVYMAKAVK